MRCCSASAPIWATAVAGQGRAYRLGGDEFCVLFDHHVAGDDPILEATLAALAEPGRPLRGRRLLRAGLAARDAETAADALRLADHRMYALKHGRRATKGEAREVLLAVLGEREPDLQRHMHDVAELARAVGTRLGLDAEDLDVVVRAAELHDIGKVAVPDSDPAQARPARRGRLELHPPAHDHRRAHRRRGRGAASRGARRARQPRALGRRRLPRRPGRRGHPARGAHRLRLRRLGRDDLRPRLSQRPGPREAAAELRAHAGTQFDADVVVAVLAVVFDADHAGASR